MARKLIFKRLIPLVVGNTYRSEGRYAKGKRIKRIVAWRVSGITITRYAQSKKIGKPNILKVRG
jgi:hypothetical protein